MYPEREAIVKILEQSPQMAAVVSSILAQDYKYVLPAERKLEA